MECFGLLVAVLFGIVLAYALTSGARRRASQRAQVLRSLAQRFAGVYIGGSWFSPPTVRFRYGDTSVLIEPLTSRKRRLVGEIRLRLAWPGVPLNCEVHSRTPECFHRLGWRYREILFDTGLDAQLFRVTTDNEKLARVGLSASVRWEIERLGKTPETAAIRLVACRGQLQIERFGTGSAESVEAFVTQCLRLYDQVRLAFAQGIAFLHEEQALLVDQAVCPICGETVRDDLVYCHRCKTVHHGECWQYNGRCATYGCCETSFARAPQATLTPSPPSPVSGDKPGT